MDTQTLLVVADRPTGQSADRLWHTLLLASLGSTAALAHYARLVAAQTPKTSLLIPGHMVSFLNGSAHLAGLDVHAYGNGTRALMDQAKTALLSDTLVINAGELPHLNVQETLSSHRRSGADVSVFFSTREADYCRERVVTNASGIAFSTVRDYMDSAHYHPAETTPLAVAVSWSGEHASEPYPLTTFGDLVERMTSHVEKQGGRIRWVHVPGVIAHPDPLDKLLAIVEQTGICAGANGKMQPFGATIAAGSRLSGPLQLGRDVRIESGAIVIGPTAIGDRVTIRRGAVLTHCIVPPDATVQSNSCHHREILGLPVRRTGRPCFVSHASIYPTPGARTCLGGIQRRMRIKRCFDVLAGAIGLLLLLPFLAVIAIAIKLTSRGPVIYRHRRQGRGGVEFDCWKFRTMVEGAEKLQKKLRHRNQVDGPQFKISNDPRITRIGAFLRRMNIDEILQLVNVLMGHMSLVGPRPSPDDENQRCPAWRKGRLSVRPGITGLWQVTRSKNRSQCDFQEWIYFDLQYVENRSIWLDLQILWQTVRVLLRLGPSSRWRRRWIPQGARPPS